MTRRVITIPVVVHVVHKRAAENISKAQIRSQITVLNRDFRATNPDKSKVPAVWQGLIGNAKIKFALATRTRREDDRRHHANEDRPRAHSGPTTR